MDISLTDRKVGCYERQGLILKIWADFNIGQNGHFFFAKKENQKFHHPYSILFLSVLHQKKDLYNFHNRVQRPIVELKKV